MGNNFQVTRIVSPTMIHPLKMSLKGNQKDYGIFRSDCIGYYELII